MANFAMVLGVRKGQATLLGEPSDLSAAKKRFSSIVQDGGTADGKAFEEVWLCDTIMGRMRRKAFCVSEVESKPAAKKAKA